MSDDLAWDYGTSGPSFTGAKGKSCRRHHYCIDRVAPDLTVTKQCCACGKERDPEKARRGKSARRRGNDFERAVATALGGTRVGMFGTEVDVEAGPFALQCKEVEAMFPERIWKLIQAIQPGATRIRGAVMGDVPGPGRKRRTLIIFDFDEWAREFGGRK